MSTTTSPEMRRPYVSRLFQPRAVRLGDGIFRWLTLAGAASILVIVAIIFFELIANSQLSLHAFGFKFFINSTWDPVNNRFGALPFIYGTVVSSLLALLIAVPLSVGTAIFINEICPRSVRKAVAYLIELLASIPSVVYGLWGIFVLAPFLHRLVEPWLAATLGWTGFFAGPPFGVGMLAAAVILAIMIVPIISSISREVMLAVPRQQREAALALGATKWETVWMAVLRNARSGIVGAVILGLGRALGETMAVTMVIGNRPEIARSLFAPGYTLASVIANEFSEATDKMYLSALFEICLALFLVTLVVNILARLLVWKVARGTPARSHAQ